MSGPAGRVRVVPGARLAPAALAGIPLALSGETIGFALSLALDAVLVVGATIEGRALGARVPEVARDTEPRMVLGAPNRITIRVHNPSDRAIRITIRDDLPEGWIADPAELRAEIPPWARRELSYTVVPPRRGVVALGDLHVRVDGAIGLGSAIATIPMAREARVYPSVLGRRHDVAARPSFLHSQGMRSVRVLGGGGEFEQLREYVRGDAFRDLDWKSSAKRRRPITRVMQQERSQIVLVAIDASRTMGSEASGGSEPATKLDHAIRAGLLLAYVALRQGDRVGLVVLADAVRVFVPPGRGTAQYRRLLEALFAVEAEPTHLELARLVELVRARVPRRALVVILSDLLDAPGDDAHATALSQHAAILRRRHLPICVTMEDEVAVRLADTAGEDPYGRAAAADLLAERAAVKARLRGAGVAIVEAPVGELAIATVQRYLELKARRAI